MIAFRDNLAAELESLRIELLAGTVAVGRFTAFTIFEPKERRIHAPCFRERVLHHSIINVCEPYFESLLVHDSYACRREKGREAALRRAEHFAARHRWFLKLDIRKYFDSIPHAVLLGEIARRFRDRRVVALWERIIRNYETAPGCGLPIGALTSQHLANFHLGAADRRIKEALRVPAYVRYMDDMALWGEREELVRAWRDLAAWLRTQLGLDLKSNAHIQPTVRGMEFLGYRVFPGGSTLNRASRRRFLRRWQWIERSRESGASREVAAQRRVLAMYSFARVARREKIMQRLWAPAIGHQPRQPRRQLVQHCCELPLRQPQQEHAGQPQQQPRLPPRPQLTPRGPEGLRD